MKNQVFIIDTSAVLSGKPINVGEATMITSPLISNEFQPGGRVYRSFQFLLEKGLCIQSPSSESVALIKKTAQETGDKEKLSPADIELLALARDVNKEPERKAIILTDDYAIQNIAKTLHIRYQGISQKGVTKKYNWRYRCPGCKKQFTEPMKICPICGTETILSRVHKKQ